MANCEFIADGLTHEQAIELIDYDPVSGVLAWRPRSVVHFPSQLACDDWNLLNAGSVISGKTAKGYVTLPFKGKRYLAHRVAWLIGHGSWPDGEIDHIDGCRSNNAANNLRVVTSSGNSRNTRVPSTNQSGVVGVRWNKSCQKWEARIKTGGVDHYLGVFTDKENAIAARKRAQERLGFHPNHGRAA